VHGVSPLTVTQSGAQLALDATFHKNLIKNFAVINQVSDEANIGYGSAR
jgi:hypothetical protein